MLGSAGLGVLAWTKVVPGVVDAVGAVVLPHPYMPEDPISRDARTAILR